MVATARPRSASPAPPVSGVLRPRSAPRVPRAGGARVRLFCLGMTIGDYPLGRRARWSPRCSASGDYYDQVVVYDWRMPRALAGLLVGLAFGMSGALFQTITRNPLASPDVIGISAGATTAVVGGIVLGIGAGLGTQTLGLLGALLAALADLPAGLAARHHRLPDHPGRHRGVVDVHERHRLPAGARRSCTRRSRSSAGWSATSTTSRGATRRRC